MSLLLGLSNHIHDIVALCANISVFIIDTTTYLLVKRRESIQ